MCLVDALKLEDEIAEMEDNAKQDDGIDGEEVYIDTHTHIYMYVHIYG